MWWNLKHRLSYIFYDVNIMHNMHTLISLIGLNTEHLFVFVMQNFPVSLDSPYK